MDKPLSNEQLLRLVQEKAAEELTVEEITQLRQGLRESPELREAVAGQLQFEEYLSDVLGDVQVPVDSILEQAEAKTDPKSRRWTWLLGLAFLLLGAGTLWLWLPEAKRPVNVSAAGSAEKDNSNAKKRASAQSKTDGPTASANGSSNAAGSSAEEDARNTNQDSVPEDDRGEDSKAGGQPVVAFKPPSPRNDPTESSAGRSSSEKNNPPPSEESSPSAKPAVERQSAPWSAALADSSPVLSFEDAAFGNAVRGPGPEIPAKELRRWLGPVPGFPHKILDGQRKDRRFAGIEGLFRLRAPWPQKAVLRLGLFRLKDFRMYLWSGRDGIELRFYERGKPKFWAAYRIRRDDNEPRPTERILVTTDNGRHWRSNLGVLELRHQNGHWVMSRGDLRLLTAAMEEPPREIYFEGRTRFSRLEMLRSEPLPPSRENRHPVVHGDLSPARRAWHTEMAWGPEVVSVRQDTHRQEDSPWTCSLPNGAELTGAADGSVELTASASEKLTWAATALQKPGLYEVIVRLAEADAGTGFYLGDQAGRPVHRVGFFREKQTGRLTFGPLKPNEQRTETKGDPNDHLVRFASRPQWLRVVVGFGKLKLWVSGDGRHWGRALQSPADTSADSYSTFGLYTLPAEGDRHIRLQKVTVRELNGITNLADKKLMRRVPPFGDLRQMDYGQWFHRVLQTRPEGVSLSTWRRACAIQCLKAAPSKALAERLFRGLFQAALEMEIPPQKVVQLLHDMALLADLGNSQDAERFADYYRRLGRRLSRAGNRHALLKTLHARLQAPLWTASRPPLLPDSLLRRELLRCVYRGQWQPLATLCRRIHFWRQSAEPRQRRSYWPEVRESLLGWAEAQALRHLPAKQRSGSVYKELMARAGSWKHPLVSTMSKEGYNVMAEFEAALEGRAFEDACRIIAAAGSAGMLGLLPDSQDPELLVSLPKAVALAMREWPELQRMMQKKVGPKALLRVREAMAEGNVEAIKSATVRFYGTEAAAEAHRWLGDRWMASGNFAQAGEHYRRARRSAPPSGRPSLRAREQLAAAMLGRADSAISQASRSLTAPVELGGRTYSPEEFRQLLQQLRQNEAAGREVSPPMAVRPQARQVPNWKPADFQVDVQIPFEGAMGRGAGNHRFRNTDWVARQLGLCAGRELLLVSNRFQINAYQTANGKLKWSTGLDGEQGKAHDWPLIPMRPVLVGERLFARRLTKHGPQMACLDVQSGEVLWQTQKTHPIVSDPLFSRNKLLALTATSPRTGLLQLHVASFDRQSGELIAEQPLIRLRDRWNHKPPCQVTVHDGNLLCCLGGTVVSSDLLGHANWVRRQRWLPPQHDARRDEHHFLPPLVHNDRLLVSQPGVRAVECLERATGRLTWRQPMPTIRRILGVTAGRVIVQTRTGFEALALHSGRRLWRHRADDVLHGYLFGEEGAFVYSRRAHAGKEGQHVLLVWLDGQTGRATHRDPLSGLQGKTVQFGPLFAAGEHVWGFRGQGYRNAERQLVRLKRSDEPAESISPTTRELAGWLPRKSASVSHHVRAVLPGWNLITPPDDVEINFHAEQQGAKDVLRTRNRKGRAVRFLRRVAVPRGGHPQLRLRVGHQAKRPWILTVDVNSTYALRRVIGEESDDPGWVDLELYLKQYAGRSIWLTVAQRPMRGNNRSPALWKRLEIVTE